MNTKRIASILVLFWGMLIATSAHAQVALSEEGVIFPDDTVLTTGTTSYGYEIGDTGPADGIVFYVEPGSDGLHGLEAAPADQSTDAEWGCSTAAITGANGTAVGTGKQNTIDIYYGCSERPIAASIAADYRGPTLDTLGWYLPSKDELNLLYQNKGTIGGFANANYWSSSEAPSNLANYQYFLNGNQFGGFKGNPNGVRAIRAF